MNKEIIQFDEYMNNDGKLFKARYDSSHWKNTEFILTGVDYTYYHCWDDDKEKGVLYRVKKSKAKFCKECGREI